MNDATTLPRTTAAAAADLAADGGDAAAGGPAGRRADLVPAVQGRHDPKQIVTTIQSAVPTVATAKASMQDWQPRQTAVGSARASNGADLAAEIGGVVDQIDFESGQTVAGGDGAAAAAAE